MRYGIFSDVHSNLEALIAAVEAYKKEGIDRYLCIGDIVGYASNPRECVEEIQALAPLAVAGNHDWAAVGLFSTEYFNREANDAVLWTKENLDEKSRRFLEGLKLIYKNEDLFLAHSTLDNPGDFNYMTDISASLESFNLLENNICFVGHTHVAGFFAKEKNGPIIYRENDVIDIKKENKYIVNVGSLGQPRDGNAKAAYCIYDTEKREVLIKRIGYNIKRAREKIFEAGLPKFFGNRLLLGI